MGTKHTLTIKDWLGKGRGDISFDVGGFVMIEKSRGGQKTYQLIINRKPDQFSSRLGMMAHLNKSNNTLAWGFMEMVLTVKEETDKGDFVSIKTYSYFDGVAVANSRAVGRLEEELTFTANKKGEFCIGTC